MARIFAIQDLDDADGITQPDVSEMKTLSQPSFYREVFQREKGKETGTVWPDERKGAHSERMKQGWASPSRRV